MDCELTDCTYIQDLDDTVSSSATKYFGTCKRSQKNFCGAFITHIYCDPVFSTAQATDKLKALYEQFLKAKNQGMADNFLFKITWDYKFKGKQLKQVIDDYQFFTHGTTK